MNAFAALVIADAVLAEPHPSQLPHPATRTARRSLGDRLSEALRRLSPGTRAGRRDGLSGSAAS